MSIGKLITSSLKEFAKDLKTHGVVQCPECRASVAINKDGNFYAHGRVRKGDRKRKARCPMSGKPAK